MTSTDVDTLPVPAEPPRRSMEEWLFFEDGPLTRDEAMEVAAKAKAFVGQLHRILLRAHERRIWLSLDYGSWAEFCAAEFDVSRSRAYQLLDLAKVQAALTTGDQPDAPAPKVDWNEEQLTEAQARPLAPFKGDRRAVRLIWERAREIAGPNDPPSQAQVQQAVDEWKVPLDGDLWQSTDRLVTGATWTDGPVWWTWQTPAAGVILYLGLGEVPAAAAMQQQALYTSEARYGDLAGVAADDLDNLVPRLIAELFARQVPSGEEVYEVSRLVADMNIEWGKRGPFTLDHDQVVGAFAELAHIYDDDYSWSDTSSHEPVDEEPPSPAAPVDPDDEIVDAEIIEDDEPVPAAADVAPGRRERLLEQLRAVEAELAGDLPATRRLQLVQDRLNLEAELDGRPVPRPAAPVSRPPAAAPPTSTSPASVGTEEVGDDGPGLPSSSTAPAPLKIPDDLPFDRMVADAIACMEAMLIDGQRPGDMRHSARWLRAVASHLENEATRREAAQQEAGAA